MSMRPEHRMLQPAALKSDQKLLWSAGRGTDVWALIQACTSGDLEGVRALIAKDASLARSHYEYRKPLYFAVRENRIDIVRFLLEHDPNSIDLWVGANEGSSRATPGQPACLALARARGLQEPTLTQPLGRGVQGGWVPEMAVRRLRSCGAMSNLPSTSHARRRSVTGSVVDTRA